MITYGLIPAVFLERENRFVIKTKIKNRTCRAYLPNPGRLWELLLPGSLVYLKKFNSKGSFKFKVIGCNKGNHFVLLDTHYTNTIVSELIQKGKIPFLKEFRVKNKEVKVNNSRIDLLLESNRGKEFFLEVKTCTLFGKCVAMFPDAVSKRASKHLLELAELAKKGYKAGVLFVVMNPEVEYFLPAYHIDPDFSANLLAFKNTLDIKAIALSFKKGFKVDSVKELEIPFKVLEKEFKDAGSYLLVLHLSTNLSLTIGKNRWDLSPGYYIYVGSAMKGLESRIKRHLKKRKKQKWHIDYLSIHAKKIIPIPIRTTERLECKIADKMKSISDEVIPNFGSTDCKCVSHLFYFKNDPILSTKFQEILTYFRIDRLCSYLS